MAANNQNLYDAIGGLFVDHQDVYKTEAVDPFELLEPLSRVNIFVGANNTGKSRFMRSISRTVEPEVKLAELFPFRDAISRDINVLSGVFSELGIGTFGSLGPHDFSYLLEQLAKERVHLDQDDFAQLREQIGKWNVAASSGTIPPIFIDGDKERLWQAVEPFVLKVRGFIRQIPEYSVKTLPVRVYIPTLRGLRQFGNSGDDHYFRATKSAYYEGAQTADGTGTRFDPEKLEIYTGLSFFKRLRSLRLGATAERRSVDTYERFLSETFFQNQSVELTPNESQGVVTIKIGRDAEQPIHHLGDGVQSAIILSFLPHVLKDTPAFFFIEEPEMFMHPGLQRKVLEFLVSNPFHRFFLTTHSNHLLDLTADVDSVSVFTFTRQQDENSNEDVTPKFSVRAVNAGCKSSLELLDVRNSSVFLVNSTIWVEGITDRLYLREMLRQYMAQGQKHDFDEDVHYSFVEYGGSNIIHWSFLDSARPHIEVDRLCAQAMVIVDGDGGEKMDRKALILKKLGRDRFIELPGRKIENMLPYSVIRSIVSDYESGSSNVIPDFAFQAYKDEYLGKFIEEEMLAGAFRRKGGYQEVSGTLKRKLEFCEKALKMVKFDALPQETKNVVAKIYRFISSCNPHPK
ncbi:MAG: AAA family ATPase [Pyrinomonadaceae bacterium]